MSTKSVWTTSLCCVQQLIILKWPANTTSTCILWLSVIYWSTSLQCMTFHTLNKREVSASLRLDNISCVNGFIAVHADAAKHTVHGKHFLSINLSWRLWNLLWDAITVSDLWMSWFFSMNLLSLLKNQSLY